MVRSIFSTSWKRSVQIRKQRKYRFNAPLHIKQKFMHVHLAPTLRTKYGLRNVQLKKGDKVKILRGQFKKKEGKVDKVDLKRNKVFVQGMEITKKEGSKVLKSISPSNLMITDLDFGDKKRKEKIEKRVKTNIEKKNESKGESK